jgi:hypothetical protein
MLLPVLGLPALSGLFLAERLATVTAMQRVGALTELITDASALVHELQRERGLSGGVLGSKGSELREELIPAALNIDARAATLPSCRRMPVSTTFFAATKASRGYRPESVLGRLVSQHNGHVPMRTLRPSRRGFGASMPRV